MPSNGERICLIAVFYVAGCLAYAQKLNDLKPTMFYTISRWHPDTHVSLRHPLSAVAPQLNYIFILLKIAILLQYDNITLGAGGMLTFVWAVRFTLIRHINFFRLHSQHGYPKSKIFLNDVLASSVVAICRDPTESFSFPTRNVQATLQRIEQRSTLR